MTNQEHSSISCWKHRGMKSPRMICKLSSPPDFRRERWARTEWGGGGWGGSLCRVCLNVTLLPLNWIKCGNHKIAGIFVFFLFVFPVSFPFCDQGDVKGWNHPWYSAWARRDLRCVVYTVHKYFIGCDYFWKSLWNGLQITRGRRGVTGRQIKESTGENSIKVILKKLQRVGDGRLPAAGEYFPWRRSNTQETTTWHDEIILKK